MSKMPEFRKMDTAERTLWDVVIVGTGMGGATLGYALSKAGLRVLFVEKGRSHLKANMALSGSYPEHSFPQAEAAQEKHKVWLSLAGRWSEALEDTSGNRPRRFVPFLGSGTGGSSALYGMALERFFPFDFQGGSPASQDADAQPGRWPVTYEGLTPYYEAAERLYRVHSSPDPLRRGQTSACPSPPPLQPANRELFEHFRTRGLHPYHLPMACAYSQGDDQCQGFLDAKGIKNDAAKCCLIPALEDGGAALLEQCEVHKLSATRTAVTGLACSRHGRHFTLRARTVVLAVGALASPAILLRSASRLWPRGLANRTDLVGRNLMRHWVDLYAVETNTPGPHAGNLKQLAFNDFYAGGDRNLGTVQSFGSLPPPGILVNQMEQDLRSAGWPRLASAFRIGKPLVRSILTRKLSRSMILASIQQDLPRHDNRVTLSDGNNSRLRLHYRLQGQDHKRIRAFRSCIHEILKPYRYTAIRQAENNQRLAHVCGTCRFGDDPNQSVLNPHNRAHDLENLYVVDGSFFPSSGGTNPGLTIAANALRVASHILEHSPHRNLRAPVEQLVESRP